MKVRITLAIVSVMALIGVPAGTTGSGSQALRYSPTRILVKFRALSRPILESDLAGFRATRAEVLDPGSVWGSADAHVVHLDSGVSVEEALALARSDPRVEYAEPDYYIYPMDTMPNDPFFGEMWGLLNTGEPFGGKPGADISATRAWDITTGSSGVVVAVADSGIDSSHPDLSDPQLGSNIWVNTREVPGNGVDDDSNGFVDDLIGWDFFSNDNDPGADPLLGSFYRHGTHVSGTIGALGNNATGVTGVAWQVKLMSLKIFGLNSGGQVTGTISDAVRAINYAIGERNRGTNVRVINASWAGSEQSQTLHDAIAAAAGAGITFVCASGNGGSDSRGDDMDLGSKLYPAAWTDLPSLISVAALDRSDGLASFSNYGHMTVTVGAPGVGIFSTVPEGGYGVSSGTSMSTPHVSGIVALLAADDPSLGPEAIKQRIVRTAEPVLALASKANSSGRANAFNALTNTLAAAGDPAISIVAATKKAVIIDGVGFVRGSIVVEVNGIPLVGKVKFDGSLFQLPNESYTNFWVKIGKAAMNQSVPVGVPVSITVLNPVTGARSAPFLFTRS